MVKKASITMVIVKKGRHHNGGGEKTWGKKKKYPKIIVKIGIWAYGNSKKDVIF